MWPALWNELWAWDGAAGSHIAQSLLKQICDTKTEAPGKFSAPVIRNTLVSSLSGHSFSASIIGDFLESSSRFSNETVKGRSMQGDGMTQDVAQA